MFVRYNEAHKIELHFVDGVLRCWSPSRKGIARVVLSKQQSEILRQIVDKHPLSAVIENFVAESSKSEGKTIEMIMADLKKSRDAVYVKCRRLGLVVEEEGAKGHTTSSIRLPKELPSVEEALKILAGILQAASQAGLDKVEVQRLHAIATLARTYEQLVSRYIIIAA